jgi:hypothetical protein
VLRRSPIVGLALALGGCVTHEPTPATLAHDARAGIAPPGVDRARLCTSWSAAVGATDPFARRHVAFAEIAPKACFVPIRYDGELSVTPGTIPEGCGYRAPDAATTLSREVLRYEAVARGDDHDLPLELSCSLAPDVRRRAAAQNARTLAALAAAPARTWPYAVVASFGYGRPEQGASPLVGWRPGDACPAVDSIDLHEYGVNVLRATRAALAWAGGVAPVVSFSGGAVHSALTEAFLMTYVATCRIGVPIDRVLVDPCADHTHTNVRNSGRFVAALGARTGYIVTDDGLQGGYLQESTAFDAIGGSIDQRALRDWGYLIGSWRQASIGIRGGFWFTPYRFFADDALGTTSCVAP